MDAFTEPSASVLLKASNKSMSNIEKIKEKQKKQRRLQQSKTGSSSEAAQSLESSSFNQASSSEPRDLKNSKISQDGMPPELGNSLKSN